ncbi:serine hydrolase domain-containing protein [Parvularcula maris]|uniref:Beta-lactamase family protein n=1 Tax=Parvularcula maris TaxID=2965077 RepID=A0A9X2L6M5_9PROT|nr:serine hydrolase domain-containing protein [Parvularcula maris]MCQ8183926.1 beta-lactamase family protein [Parvularcula maris]
MRLQALSMIALLLGCTAGEDQDGAARGTERGGEPAFDGAVLDRLVPGLIEAQGVAGIGIAVVENGNLVWQGYYGEQAPGTPVTEKTAFNVASVAKVLTAETMLSLHEAGEIDLDEPISPYVSHPDLSQDERYELLTPRMLLAHRGGLLNWAYRYEDGKLAFDHDPGTKTSYSGAGIELVARYAEAKTGKPLARLAREEVLEPLGIEDISLGVVPDWAKGRMSVPMTAEGEWTTIAATNPGLAAGDANSAADDLVVTVPAFAKLIAALSEKSSALSTDWEVRTLVRGSLDSDPVYRCASFDWLRCPDSYGHSAGWHSFSWDDHAVLSHSGSDLGENAFVYVSPDTGRGAVIFVNGANGWPAMTRIIEAIGDEPLLADYYRGLVEERMGLPMPPLGETAR